MGKAIFFMVFNFLIVTQLGATDWTIMVYMGADNGMADQAYKDLAEMVSVGSTDKVKIIVQLDTPDADSLPGTRRYLIEKDTPVLLDQVGKLDMGDPQTLIDFAGFTARNYPAKNYFLILWDHGSGWPNGNAVNGPRRSIIDDWSGHSSMGVADGELKQAVSGIKAVLGKKLALLGFDACLMNMVEVALEIKDGARIMLGSEGLVPYDGWPYGQVLKIVVDNPGKSSAELASEIVSEFIDSYGDLDLCFSAVDLEQLNDCLEPLARLVEVLALDAGNSLIKTGRETVQTFPEPGREPSPHDEYIDLIDFIELITAMPEIENEARTCLECLQKAVLKTANSGSSLTHAHGISIWFPYYWLSFKRQFPSYARLGFAGSVSWLGFLNSYYGLDDIDPTQSKFAESVVNRTNSYRLFWSRSFDLSDVRYELRELKGTREIFSDGAQSADNWNLDGFSLSNQYAHSLDFSFFSGSADNLDNRLTLQPPLGLPQGGLVSFFVLYQTEEAYDLSLTNVKRDVLYLEISSDGSRWSALDSLYGDSLIWTEHRYFLESRDSVYLRFRYKSDLGENGVGVFIDDIKMYTFDTMRTVAAQLTDTSFYFFNKTAGEYAYGVFAIDDAGNRSSVTQFFTVSAEDYALPFSIPSPFHDSCQIICDYPSASEPEIFIYTLNGELIKRFPFSAIGNKQLTWDGKNERGSPVASGIYLVVVKDRDFTRLGKIARVR